MHILLISHNYPFESDPGFGFFCKQQAEALVRQNHKVGVVCPLAYSVLRIIVNKGKFYFGMRKRDEGGVLSALFFFPSVPKIKRLRLYLIRKIGMWLIDQYISKNGKPDVFHLHVFHAARLAIDASRRYNIPLVWTEHFSDIDRKLTDARDEVVLSELSKTAVHRIAVSRTFQKSLEQKFGRPFHYIPNVYQSDLFKYEALLAPTSPFVLIHAGNLDANKNQERLIAAFKIAFSLNPGVKLKIVGEGEDWSHLQRIIATSSLESQIEMTGYLSAAELREQFRQSHAFVLSSDYETFGVAALEAMACGLPVIATKCGGPESFITSDRLGILVDKSPEALADGMLKVYKNYNKYRSDEIAQYAKDNFSYEAVGKRLTELYQKCIS